MRFADLAETSEAVRAAPGRKAKAEAIAATLRLLPGEEVAAGTAFLAGDLLQRQIGVGWASLREVPEPAGSATLTVADVAATFERIGALGGPGSVAARRDELAALFAAATTDEQRLLRGLLAGDLRQGAQAGLMTDAVAKAAAVPVAAVRRALMLSGDLPATAALALGEGEEGLAAVRLEVGRPVQPMLAGTAKSVDEALEKACGGAAPAGQDPSRAAHEVAVEYKLDGARIQVHRDGDDVTIASRSLDDLTARLPAVVAAVRALPADRVVLDGEAIALRPDGRPELFQVTASRIASGAPGVTPVFFDILHLDGEDLLDAPLAQRAEALARAVPDAALRVPRIVTGDVEAARAHFDAALAAGHEGVVVKALDAPYAAGRRGASWLKVKPRHTLDLVVLAVEWGSGRRQGWLSNLHLGARAVDGDGFVMLGKTFKGL
ncbi:MAG: ligase 1, partial [Solirubrobacteraceae bacterium]|nr:ligase 1 [Solirubrobacteraceae bacterium]